jgi:FkbM family methyltransferase
MENKEMITDNDIIKSVVATEKPVYIYGCGDIGSCVLKYLQKNNISVQGFLVDDEYYLYSERKLGYDVKKLSDVKKNPGYVFIGFADVVRAKQRLEKYTSSDDIKCISNPYVYLEPYEISEKFYADNKDEFEKSKKLFEDKLSKDLFDAYLKVRINKCYEYLLPYGGCKTYFNDEIMNLSREEVYVDCGAYDGDSVLEFVKATQGIYQKIFAIEPDSTNFNELTRNMNERNIKDVKCFNNGVWNKKEKLYFSANDEQESGILTSESKNLIQADTLDDMLKGEKITFIKMSVQGAEKEAIMGAANILVCQEPKLAITIFMKPNSLIEIPKLIKKINPNYKIYLRCEESFFARVILYAKV